MPAAGPPGPILTPDASAGRPGATADWRWKARRALARFGPREIPALLAALSGGDDPTIRAFAAESLARLGADAHGAEEALRHAARHDPDPGVRASAAAAVAAVQQDPPAG
jgi:hypothetical protein